ncbi:MAG: hypothetical protein PWQ96_1637 [Clostridia bacterium]|nr:hypothetical protein [Clostridia bacterium]
MEEVVVTKYWMLGVVGMMMLYGIFVLIGSNRNKEKA